MKVNSAAHYVFFRLNSTCGAILFFCGHGVHFWLTSIFFIFFIDWHESRMTQLVTGAAFWISDIHGAKWCFSQESQLRRYWKALREAIPHRAQRIFPDSIADCPSSAATLHWWQFWLRGWWDVALCWVMRIITIFGRRLFNAHHERLRLAFRTHLSEHRHLRDLWHQI